MTAHLYFLIRVSLCAYTLIRLGCQASELQGSSDSGVTDHHAQFLLWTPMVGTQSLVFEEHCLLSSHLDLTFVF